MRTHGRRDRSQSPSKSKHAKTCAMRTCFACFCSIGFCSVSLRPLFCIFGVRFAAFGRCAIGPTCLRHCFASLGCVFQHFGRFAIGQTCLGDKRRLAFGALSRKTTTRAKQPSSDKASGGGVRADRSRPWQLARHCAGNF